MILKFELPLVAYSSQIIKIKVKPGLENEAQQKLNELDLTTWAQRYAEDDDYWQNLDINYQQTYFDIDEEYLTKDTASEQLLED